jgi:hypothetical protein
MRGRRRSGLTVGAVAMAVALATGAAAQNDPPPPSGGFDTTTCHGRGAHPPRNGRLVGHAKGKHGLFSVRANGSGLHRETHPPHLYEDFFPSASRDGHSIAFLRLYMPNQDDRPQRLMVVDVRTHRTRVLTSEFVQPFAPAWSPDGMWVTAGALQPPVPRGTPFKRTATFIHPDGAGRRELDAGGYLMLNGSWSANGRCFAAVARYQDQPGGFNGGDAGVGVLSSDGGRPNTFVPRPPACPAGTGCASTVTNFGPNQPNYIAWTADGRGILALRGIYRKAPKHPDDPPDEVDVMRSGLSSSQPGRILLRNALAPHLAPNGRLIAAYSTRRRSFGVFRPGGRLVHAFPRFMIEAWAPAPR